MLPKTGGSCVGTRITDYSAFIDLLAPLLCDLNSSTKEPRRGEAAGQHTVSMPAQALRYISGGVGMRSNREDDYIYARHREQVGKYLKREFTLNPSSATAIVYTATAYLNDPDVQANPNEYKRATELVSNGAGFFLVTVISYETTQLPPIGIARFVRNLAGGNNAYKTMTREQILDMARSSLSYWSRYSTIADLPEDEEQSTLKQEYYIYESDLKHSGVNSFRGFLEGITSHSTDSSQHGLQLSADQLREEAKKLVEQHDRILSSLR
jgi:hypothetical protein